MRLFAPGFALGVYYIFHCYQLPSLVFLLLVWAVWFVVMRQQKTWFTVLLMGFVSGLLWVVIYHALFMPKPLSGKALYQPIAVQGKVVGLPQHHQNYTSFYLLSDSLAKHSRLLKLSWYFPDKKIKPGQQWQLLLKLKPFRNLANPAGFNAKQWALQKGITARGYVLKSYSTNQLLATHWYWAPLSYLRYQFKQKIHQALPANLMRRFILALTLGDRSEITSQDWRTLQRTGTNHLIAISGLHIGLIAGVIYWLAKWLLRFFPRLFLYAPLQQWAAVLSLLAAFFYSALAGFALPTQRALIMLMVFYVALFQKRQIPPWHSFAIALFLVLLIDPVAVLSISFWLSFTAVAVIIYTMSGRLKQPSRLMAAMKVQLIVVIGLLPLTLWFFDQSSLVAPLANLVAIPLLTFVVVPVSLLACCFLWINTFLVHSLLQLSSVLMQWTWSYLTLLSHYSFAALHYGFQGYVILWLALLAFFILLAPRGFPKKSLALVLLLPAVSLSHTTLSNGAVQVTVFNVGQGLSVLVQTRHHNLLYDTGAAFNSGNSMAKMAVIPSLYRLGVSRLDTLMVSHLDNDHAGGTEAILQAFPVKKLLTSDPTAFLHAQQCYIGQDWNWDGVQFKVLAPDHYLSNNRNNLSCVLSVQTGNERVLLPGDIEKKSEYHLVRTHAQALHSGLLIAPHHGSKTSSTWPLVLAVRPRYVVFSAGYKNRFGFPAPVVQARYHSVNSRLFNTAKSGALLFMMNGRALSKPIEYRPRQAYWWNKG